MAPPNGPTNGQTRGWIGFAYSLFDRGGPVVSLLLALAFVLSVKYFLGEIGRLQGVVERFYVERLACETSRVAQLERLAGCHCERP